MSLKSKDNNFVAEDRNWRSYILNELNGAKQWEEDWGFLTSGNALSNDTVDDKIRKLEARMEELKQEPLRTTSATYGRGSNLEKYMVTEYNITKNKELRACDRKPKKDRKS